LRGLLIVEAEQMKDAVDKVADQFLLPRGAELRRLGLGYLDTDVNIAVRSLIFFG
jgi:hypothetical protein